jgi:hypothetical protein
MDPFGLDPEMDALSAADEDVDMDDAAREDAGLLDEDDDRSHGTEPESGEDLADTFAQ